MKNRGKVSTATIAEKLKKVEDDLGISDLINTEVQEISPLLFINGRLDRKKHSYLAKNFALLGSLNEEVKSYCKGVDLTVLNYLIFRGLQSIKEKNEFLSIEYSEFEEQMKLNS
jgi:hypothetical protein